MPKKKYLPTHRPRSRNNETIRNGQEVCSCLSHFAPSLGPKIGRALLFPLQCQFSFAKQKLVSFKGEAVLNGTQITPIICQSKPNSRTVDFNCSVKDGINWNNLLSSVGEPSPYTSSLEYVDVVISNTMIIRLYKDFGMDVQFQFAESFLKGSISLKDYRLDPTVPHEFVSRAL